MMGCMKKLTALFVACAAVFFLTACETKIAVESAAEPIATYSDMTGSLDGKIKTDLKTAFNATNIALERDLKYFRVGQKETRHGWKIYARAELDRQIVVELIKAEDGFVNISISFGDGDLMRSQKIFNTIAKEVRTISM